MMLKGPLRRVFFSVVKYMRINTVHIQSKQRIITGTQHLKQAHFMERNNIRIAEGPNENIFNFHYVVQSLLHVMYQKVHILV